MFQENVMPPKRRECENNIIFSQYNAHCALPVSTCLVALPGTFPENEIAKNSDSFAVLVFAWNVYGIVSTLYYYSHSVNSFYNI